MRIKKTPLAWIAAGIVLAIALSLALFAIQHARYFSASELDKKPYPMRRVDLDFPPVKDGIEYYGKLRIDMYIDSKGGVDRVEVVDAKVPARLRDIAVNAFSQTRWEPGRKWGMRVKSLEVVEIEFEPPAGARGQALTQPDL